MGVAKNEPQHFGSDNGDYQATETLHRAKHWSDELNDILEFIRDVDFSKLLTSLLVQHNRNRHDLMEYLNQNDYYLTRSSLDRYFNGYRLPDTEFCIKFANFLQLSPKERQGLVVTVQLARRPSRLMRFVNELRAVS